MAISNPHITRALGARTDSHFRPLHTIRSVSRIYCLQSARILTNEEQCTSWKIRKQTVELLANMSSSIGTWTFSPLVTEFPTNILPNIGFWNASNGTWEYQIQLAWPLNWTSPLGNSTVETM